MTIIYIKYKTFRCYPFSRSVPDKGEGGGMGRLNGLGGLGGKFKLALGRGGSDSEKTTDFAQAANLVPPPRPLTSGRRKSSVAPSATFMEFHSNPSSTNLKAMAKDPVKICWDALPPDTKEKQENIKKTVAQSYVQDTHMEAIGQAAKEGRFAISFRPAGELTLKRVKQGAPMKGHEILEKTIKPSAVTSLPGQEAAVRIAHFALADVDGYVGHWGEKGELKGVYIDPRVLESPSAGHADPYAAIRSHLKEAPNGQAIYKVDESTLKKDMQVLRQAIPDWKGLLFTGDYDTHDMVDMKPIEKSTGYKAVAFFNSDKEEQIISSVNSAISRSDSTRRRSVQDKGDAYKAVQHGAQYNYIAFTRAHEPQKPLVEGVAKPSFPLALCDQGAWALIENEDELKNFYEKNNISLKRAWRSTEEMDKLIDEDRQSRNSSLGSDPSSSNKSSVFSPRDRTNVFSGITEETIADLKRTQSNLF